MTIRATYVGQGTYGFPGAGTFKAGETKTVAKSVGAALLHNKRFSLDIDEFEMLDVAHGDKLATAFAGNLDTNTGYGGGSIDIIRAGDLAGLHWRINTCFGKNPNGLHPVVRKYLEVNDLIPKVEFLHCLAHNFEVATAPNVIGMTMWESTQIPDGRYIEKWPKWAPAINQNCQQLVVPCKYNADVFAACGVRVPIAVLNYGLDGDEWPFQERRKNGKFRVSLFGDLTSRKSPFEAVQMFQQAFPSETDVELVLKTAHGRLGLGHFGIPQFSDPRIRVIDQTWTRGQIKSLLNDTSVFIWPSKGEGFGLPPLQAALSGVPVLMTTHSGMAEYFDPKYFTEIEFSGMGEAPMGGLWFLPNVEQGAAQLRAMYENYSKYEKKAVKAAKYVRDNFNLDVFGKNIRKIVEDNL